jgi:tetratricopeptide (TPR) repeat protein
MGSAGKCLRAFVISLAVSNVESLLLRPFGGDSALIRKNGPRTISCAANKKNLSASDRERRDEEKRRLDRANDVIVGKTSALAGAKDYAIDPKSTEEEWMRQASAIEREIYRQTDRGMALLKMLKLEEAMDAFNIVFTLRPNAYLWQAGIAQFYLGEIKGAANTFSRCAALYESRFGFPASEERIWWYACQLKLLSLMTRSERKESLDRGGLGSTLTPLPQSETTAELLKSESRKAIRIAHDMFEATALDDKVNTILSRAKMKSIGGTFDKKPVTDRKMWKLNSWYYLGLHYDVIGFPTESKECLKKALRLCPSSGNGADIIHTLPLLHMSQRDWFDSEIFKDEAFETKRQSGGKVGPDASIIDPVLTESIRSDLVDIRHSDLKDALKSRGLRVVGSKDELVDRLYESLIADTGLTP